MQPKAPNAKCSVLMCSDLHCTNQYETTTAAFEHDKLDSIWLVHIAWSICNNKWAICILCNKFKMKRQIIE